MEIKAVKFRKEGFYSQPLVFGGEEGTDKFDKNIRCRGSLQNYLIDTGDEVNLVDTGSPAGTPEEVFDENSTLYTGKDICSYMEAFSALGYKPEQVTIANDKFFWRLLFADSQGADVRERICEAF